MICAIQKCGLGAHTPYRLCWIHYIQHVVATYEPGKIDSLPIKRAIRHRIDSGRVGRDELAEVLGVTIHEIDSALNPRRVWVTYPTFDRWATLLHLDISPLHEAVA